MNRKNHITPYLCCRPAAEAIAFYERALGAKETSRFTMPDGRVGHAELAVGDAVVFLADEYPEEGFVAPIAGQAASAILLHLDVPDADAAFTRAVAAGATPVRAVADNGHGQRGGKIRDPFGHAWLLVAEIAPEPGPRVEDLWGKLDLITPMAIRVAGTLRIADHVRSGHADLSSLAAAAGADREALGRLLRYLAARGLFREIERERFANTAESEHLLEGAPHATRGWIDLEGFGGRMDLAFFGLLETVRTGQAPRSTAKDDLSASETESYDTVMEAQSIRQAPPIVAALAIPAAPTHVVDVGGGTGTLLMEMLRRFEGARGTIVELPKTAAAARRRVEADGFAGRCDVIDGDFLTAPLPKADLYVMKFVLHALEDDAAARLLSRCREASGGIGRVLVIERTTETEGDLAPFTAMDLRMLILGHGRERTREEYAALARRAGLEVASVTRTPVDVHAIELRAAD